MKPLALMIGLIGTAILPYECSAQVLDNPFSQYIQREITLTPDAGNANDTNAAIHTIDPWPPYARNTRIPDTGRHAVDSVERMYRNPDPFTQQQGASATGAAALGAAVGAAGALGALGGAGAATGTPMVGTPGGY